MEDNEPLLRAYGKKLVRMDEDTIECCWNRLYSWNKYLYPIFDFLWACRCKTTRAFIFGPGDRIYTRNIVRSLKKNNMLGYWANSWGLSEKEILPKFIKWLYIFNRIKILKI